MQAIDRQAVGDGAVFAGAAGVEGVFGFEAWVLGDEARFGGDEGGVFGGAAFDIGLDEEGAAGDEHAAQLGQEFGGDDEALGVALLPPRVGEVHEDGACAGVGEAGEGFAGVFREHAGAVSEAAFAHAVVDDGRPFTANFHAEQENFRISGQAFEDEAAASGADFNLDRRRACADERSRIDLFTFGKSRRVLVRVRFHAGVDAKTRRVLAQADSPRWLRIASSWWGFMLAAGVLAALSIRDVLAANGGAPAVPLDDSYIHFQFARSFAEGHPFVYSPGAAPVAGATSLLWPLLLALPHALGAHGLTLIPFAWGLGFGALGLLAHETARAAEGVVSPRVAWLAGALSLAFSANTWFAASGMEVLPLAWLLMRCARRAAEWLEGERERFWELLLLAAVTPLMRPEGVLGSVLVAVALGFGSAHEGARSSVAKRVGYAALCLAFPLVPPLVYLGFTGHATQTTTLVKWLPFSPYLDARSLYAQILYNWQLFWSTLVDGQLWSAAFVPEHSKFAVWLALPALTFAGQARMRNARAWLLLALGLGILLPTTYDSFLWNRLRYLWPFTGPWLIGLVALGDQIADFAQLAWRRLSALRYLLSVAIGGALVGKFPFALYDLAQSAHAISAQHVELGMWAERALPKDARIGVNDTGAIAYFSGHPVFDIVGLTTTGEARYWSAGAGSRFEHYERLSRDALPSHFIVYPPWFALPDLLGPCLTERTVHATILGGETMVACRADYERLGSGERPSLLEFWPLKPRDVLDVADLDSEAAHHYVLLPASQGDDVLLSNGVVLDGGRLHRTRESFRLDLSKSGRLVTRLGAEQPLTVNLRVGGRLIDRWTVSRPDFEDHVLSLPADVPAGPAELELSTDGGTFSALHYWSYDAPQ